MPVITMIIMIIFVILEQESQNLGFNLQMPLS